MPIPSFVSSLRPPRLVSKSTDASSRSELPPRLAVDTRNKPADSLSVSIPSIPSDEPPAQKHGSDATKRRSFLPQRGLPQSTLRTAMNSHDESTKSDASDSPNGRSTSTPSKQSVVADTQQGRPRPRSLYQLRPTNLNANAPAETTSKSSRSAGLQRSESLRRSGVPSQAPQPPGRSHARTRSTNIVTGARKTSGEVNPRTERPRSLVAAPRSGASADAAASSTRTFAKLEGLSRSASARVKPEATRERAKTNISAESDELRSQARNREVTKEELRKPARPTFSTLQQHYTPRKTAKAPTSTFLHPAPDTPVQHLAPEIIALQSELFQLHLLHKASAHISQRWELSAQKSLRMKFDEVANLYQVMCEYERLDLEQKNITALREWNGASASGLVQHIQALSGPLSELPSLVDTGGRFHRLVHGFNRWMSQVEEVWSVRNSHHDRAGHMGSLEGLGAWWKEGNAVLLRKVTALLRALDRLSPPAQGSSIACMVTTYQKLLEGLKAELQIMQAIEHDVVAKEKQWIEDRLRVIARNTGARIETTKGGESWRM